MSLDTRFTGCPVAPCKTGSVEFNQVMNLVCIRRYQKYFIFFCTIYNLFWYCMCMILCYGFLCSPGASHFKAWNWSSRQGTIAKTTSIPGRGRASPGCSYLQFIKEFVELACIGMINIQRREISEHWVAEDLGSFFPRALPSVKAHMWIRKCMWCSLQANVRVHICLHLVQPMYLQNHAESCNIHLCYISDPYNKKTPWRACVTCQYGTSTLPNWHVPTTECMLTSMTSSSSTGRSAQAQPVTASPAQLRPMRGSRLTWAKPGSTTLLAGRIVARVLAVARRGERGQCH